MAVVQRICKKYEGQTAFVRKDGPVSIDCPYVDRLSAIDNDTVMELYRRVLTNARTLSGLRTSRDLPSDMSCGEFTEHVVGSGRMVECGAQLFGMDASLRFFADADGRLIRCETSSSYRNIVRAAMERAVSRGSISSFYDAYVDLTADIFVEKLRFTAGKRDQVDFKDGILSLVVWDH
jgi:hypothetical protein